jgi:hypothetical protein
MIEAQTQAELKHKERDKMRAELDGVHHTHQQAKLMIDKLTATSRDKTIELDNNHKDLARLSQLIMAETKHIDDSNQSIRALKTAS